MSIEAWGGDDDDGFGDVRDAHERQLLEDGWIDEQQAARLIAERDELKAVLCELLLIALVEVASARRAAENGHGSEDAAWRAREVVERARRLLGF